MATEKQLVEVLKKEIPNIGEFYSDKEIKSILKNIESPVVETIADDFMEEVWETPIRRCSHCGKLMKEGYWLDDKYACSDECRNEIYKKDEGAKDDNEAYCFYLRDCFCLTDEDIKDKTAAEIEEEFRENEISDMVMYTEWY